MRYEGCLSQPYISPLPCNNKENFLQVVPPEQISDCYCVHTFLNQLDLGTINLGVRFSACLAMGPSTPQLTGKSQRVTASAMDVFTLGVGLGGYETNIFLAWCDCRVINSSASDAATKLVSWLHVGYKTTSLAAMELGVTCIWP